MQRSAFVAIRCSAELSTGVFKHECDGERALVAQLVGERGPGRGGGGVDAWCQPVTKESVRVLSVAQGLFHEREVVQRGERARVRGAQRAAEPVQRPLGQRQRRPVLAEVLV